MYTAVSDEVFVAVGVAAAVICGIIAAIAGIISYVLYSLAYMKMFRKAGEAGWKGWVPFVSEWTFFKIVTGNGANMFRLLIPFYNIVYAIIATIKLGKVFGKSNGFCVGLVFVPEVFYLILAFGKSQYIGFENKSAQDQYQY